MQFPPESLCLHVYIIVLGYIILLLYYRELNHAMPCQSHYLHISTLFIKPSDNCDDQVVTFAKCNVCQNPITSLRDLNMAYYTHDIPTVNSRVILYLLIILPL